MMGAPVIAKASAARNAAQDATLREGARERAKVRRALSRARAEARKLERAEQLLRDAVPIAGTPAENYLRLRGLEPCSSLLFHPDCPSFGGVRFPALLAPMTDPLSGRLTGALRTFLRSDGNGKAPIPHSKQMLGKRGVIRLGDCDLTPALGIPKGTEDALSVMQHIWPGLVWSCCGTGGIAAFPVIPGVQELLIFADHSARGVEAARQCVTRWNAGGFRKVRVILPPTGFSDWNEAIRAGEIVLSKSGAQP